MYFREFFQELWGISPFKWQEELASKVLNQAWPECIVLPPAAGKTTCMDIAIYALAKSQETLSSQFVPRRIFFVVDRRVIVDEAFERAQELAAKLREARGGFAKVVADRLRALSGEDIPLVPLRLRGGIARPGVWNISPVQPVIAVGTVDQIGSRLLFRGYGLSANMWPVHAGLVGNDSLIFLDEVHCATPFLETLFAVRRLRLQAQRPLQLPFQVVVMSATPPDVIGGDIFRDTSAEALDPNSILGRRIHAQKPASLVVAKPEDGEKGGWIRRLARELVRQSLDLIQKWQEEYRSHPMMHPALLIFCNRVETARLVYEFLPKEEVVVSLVTGRMRPFDKEDMVDNLLATLSAARSFSRRLERPCIIVSTQSLEVGANLDFDLLVTECASLDALRQRFGRLNRMGRDIHARAVIVVRADQERNSGDDPIYGPALAKTWQWLKKQCKGKNKTVDFSTAHFLKLSAADEKFDSELCAPKEQAPLLLPAYMDILSQTSPIPEPSPNISLFLHGVKASADVLVCWRADLEPTTEQYWPGIISMCPPSTPECVSVPIWQVRHWLAGDMVMEGPDVEGLVEESPQQGRDEESRTGRVVVRWDPVTQGFDILRGRKGGAALRPGDVLIIPSYIGGLHELTTTGSDSVLDLGDRSQDVREGGFFWLRLHPKVLEQWPGSCSLISLIYADIDLEADFDGFLRDLREGLEAWMPHLCGPHEWIRRLVGACVRGLADRSLNVFRYPEPAVGFVLSSAAKPAMTSALVEVPLDVHLNMVAACCDKYAQLCGVDSRLGLVLREVGLHHDIGKADPRFQAWLRGGVPAYGCLLAKSTQERTPQLREAARDRAGFPRGFRHEFLSVQLLESLSEPLFSDIDDNELCLHLIESHHGYCRPFARVTEDPNPVVVELNFAGRIYRNRSDSICAMGVIDGGPAERFWRLTRRYGWWGLAWMEAVVRLADHVVSSQGV